MIKNNIIEITINIKRFNIEDLKKDNKMNKFKVISILIILIGINMVNASSFHEIDIYYNKGEITINKVDKIESYEDMENISRILGCQSMCTKGEVSNMSTVISFSLGYHYIIRKSDNVATIKKQLIELYRKILRM